MLRKPLLTLLLFVFTISVSGQSDWEKFEKLKSIKSSDVKVLAEKITKNYEDPLDKIKAIYYWVANHMEYDFSMLKKVRKEHAKGKRYTHAELKEKRAKDIKSALSNGEGICQDYARIFEALCLQAGIEAKFIGGLVKTRTGSAESHAWNAVMYEGEWQLVDATFGSGMLRRKRFIPNFSPSYFFVDKEVFSLSHFPNDKRWQLQEQEIELDEFKNCLKIGRGYIDYEITNLNRMEYDIELATGENLVIEFEAGKPLEEVIFFSLIDRTRLPIKIEEDNLSYRIEVQESLIVGGEHVFKSGDQELFIYKMWGK